MPANAIGISIADTTTAPTLERTSITGNFTNPTTIVYGLQLTNVNAGARIVDLTIRFNAQGNGSAGIYLISSVAKIERATIEFNGNGGLLGVNVQQSFLALEASSISSVSTAILGMSLTNNSNVKLDRCTISLQGAMTTAISKSVGSSLFVGGSKLEAGTTVSGNSPLPTCMFTYTGAYVPLNSVCM